MALCADDQFFINCPNHIWTGYWDTLSLLHSLGRGMGGWPAMFRNHAHRARALRWRFPRRRVAVEVRWIATDETPDVIGAVDWENRIYSRLLADDITKTFAGDDGRLPGIADKELMGFVVGGVAGFAAHPGNMMAIGEAI